MNDDLNNSSIHSSKRKVRGNSFLAPQIAAKRARQQSSSPPEDPANANLAVHPQLAVIFQFFIDNFTDKSRIACFVLVGGN